MVGSFFFPVMYRVFIFFLHPTWLAVFLKHQQYQLPCHSSNSMVRVAIQAPNTSDTLQIMIITMMTIATLYIYNIYI